MLAGQPSPTVQLPVLLRWASGRNTSSTCRLNQLRQVPRCTPWVSQSTMPCSRIDACAWLRLAASVTTSSSTPSCLYTPATDPVTPFLVAVISGVKVAGLTAALTPR